MIDGLRESDDESGGGGGEFSGWQRRQIVMQPLTDVNFRGQGKAMSRTLFTSNSFMIIHSD